MKNVAFDNDTSQNIHSHPYISYITNERLQVEEQLHSKNYFLEMPRSRVKMRFLYMTKMSRQKLKYLENKKSFQDEIKSIFHQFHKLCHSDTGLKF